MFSYVYSSASSYFHPRSNEDQPEAGPSTTTVIRKRPLNWIPSPSAYTPTTSPNDPTTNPSASSVINEVLTSTDLYKILGVSRSQSLDKAALRHAYLSRSKSCHPDKVPGEDATRAFQMVSVAYSTLSTPSEKRAYDSRSHTTPYDVFAARSHDADTTFRGVVLTVFQDFLDGDLEMIRTLLKAISDINPGLHLGEDGIDSILSTLHELRVKALTCQLYVHTLHVELTRLIELQHAFRQLQYLDLIGRSRITVQITRVTLSLPLALERATLQAGAPPQGTLLPKPISSVIGGVDVVLERMEHFMGG